MKLRFDKLFYKDLYKISDKSVAIEVSEIIAEKGTATTFSSIRNLKKLKGYKNAMTSFR